MEEKKQTADIPQGVAGLLTYFFPFLGGIFFLIVEHENKLVRFHAVQSLLLWVFFVVAGAILSWIPIINILYYLFVLVVWIFIMLQAVMERMYELPFIGPMAKRQVLGAEEQEQTGGEGRTEGGKED